MLEPLMSGFKKKEIQKKCKDGKEKVTPRVMMTALRRRRDLTLSHSALARQPCTVLNRSTIHPLWPQRSP